MDNMVLQKVWQQGQRLTVDDLSGCAFTGEDAAHTFEISGKNASGAVAISGTIAGKFLRSDNVTVPVTGTASDGVASITLTEDCYAVPGRFIFSVYANDGTHNICIYCGVGNVLRTDSGEYEGGEIITDVTALINAIETAVATIPADYSTLLAAIAPTFSASTAYGAGSYVWYDGNLYKFTADHAAGSWTGTDVAAVALANDVADLKSAFDAVFSGENLFDSATATDGKRINGSGGLNDDASCYTSDYIAVYPNKYYTKNSPVTDIRHRLAVYNASKVFISGELYEANLVLMPETAAYIRICGLLTEKSTADVSILTVKDDEARGEIEQLGEQVDDNTQDISDLDSAFTGFKTEITEEYTATNLLNGTTWQNGWVSQTSGNISANDSYVTSDYIAVSAGKYLISSKNRQRCEIFTLAVYDSGKTVIPGDGEQADGKQALTGYFQLPSGAAFVRITYRTSVYSSDIIVGLYDTNIGYDISSFLVIKEQALYPVYAELTEIEESAKSKWFGKIMASYGDSQTNQNKWQPIVVGNLGMTSRKFGISGATIAVRSTNNPGDCLSSSYYLGQLDTFLDEEGFDVILIMGGTNDWRYDGVNFLVADGYKNILIGDNTDTGNLTFKGALKTIVAHLQARYPSKVVALMSNIGGRAINDPTDTPATGMTAPLVNANGYTQATFAQATREIAEYIGIPFIDVYSCGINIYNTAYYLQDGLHINSTTGAKKVADYVISGLQSIQPFLS